MNKMEKAVEQALNDILVFRDDDEVLRIILERLFVQGERSGIESIIKMADEEKK